MTEIEFALNTFYLLMSGALVMWMAAGFYNVRGWIGKVKECCRDCN
jgi:Amt family ammonium transporter